MELNTQKKQVRNVGLDLYRIIAALNIFLFHSAIHINCTYSVFTPFVRMGAIFMTAFFLLSGFTLYSTWQTKALYDFKVIKKFYIKRVINILPLYYSVALLYILFLGQESLYQNIIIAPIELFAIQSYFDSLFNITHNNGTWFVSCIIICYLIYPYIQEIVKQMSTKTKIITVVMISGILLWSPIVVDCFNLNSIYSNPLFRMLEFIIGVLIASMIPHIAKCRLARIIFSRCAVILEFSFLICCVTVAFKLNFHIGDYMYYSWIALPLFVVILVSLSRVNIPQWLKNSKLITYLSRASYAFFLAQFFTWKTSLYIISIIGVETNLFRCLTSFLVCLGYTVLLHEVIEKPISKILTVCFNSYLKQ